MTLQARWVGNLEVSVLPNLNIDVMENAEFRERCSKDSYSLTAFKIRNRKTQNFCVSFFFRKAQTFCGFQYSLDQTALIVFQRCTVLSQRYSSLV
eukprot:m.552485 g.552485  ORF g.552485 m.552485 type:complete len:95 (-) comp22166_c0_seq1:81-365(-)